MREIFDLSKAYLQVVLAVLLCACIMAIVSVAFAQDAASLPTSLPADLETGEALKLLITSLGGLNGASALAAVAVGVQVLMAFFRSPLANFAGKYRLLIVSALSMVFGVLALKLSGVDWVGALVHSATLTSVMVFGNQVLKQFKKEA